MVGGMNGAGGMVNHLSSISGSNAISNHFIINEADEFNLMDEERKQANIS